MKRSWWFGTLFLMVAALAPASEVPLTPPMAPEASTSGCQDQAATTDPLLALFGPDPTEVSLGFCGGCSTDPCAGAQVGSPCYNPFSGGWGGCIPPFSTQCPGSTNSNNWQCQCAEYYF